MTVHRCESKVTVAAPLAEVWDFFSDPRNLADITPPSMHFCITSDPPDRVYAGLIVTYSVRPIGPIRTTWVTEITHLDEGRMFVDEQRAGPYRLWHHQHHFRAVGDVTEMRDIVHYQLPFGVLGDLVERFVVRDRIQGIFTHRQTAIEDRFGVLQRADSNTDATQIVYENAADRLTLLGGGSRNE